MSETQIDCPGRDRPAALLAAMGIHAVGPCTGKLRIVGEHCYPAKSNPGRYIARCDHCLGYWTVGVLEPSTDGMSPENKADFESRRTGLKRQEPPSTVGVVA
jgi:hypothetical protein